MSILLLTLMLPSETPLKPFSESYVDFALPIEVLSCDKLCFLCSLVCFIYGWDRVMDCLNVRIYCFDIISSLNTKFFQIWSSVTGYGELNHRQPKRTICGFGLQRSFGRNILELLVYYLMPNKCKKS